ncbi:hypothetical protein [Desulfosporosinus meridiei]|uniref:Uncharacterized protein n=1 Tax=Desulfosporosinus meridiei (strain ATCC BAA-275 / DSM 13257 / KCTC 12902 / NCIMB 13706 / S10) TaxID=768704 RepID=J7J4V5_DESMD|nr:hypothetical protein [Desulfosporosinus meridiei]AFQ45981.1 hypothetical protein Desmer_4152 [Desulfosporosinus meridiei DSM 13257]
MASTSFSMTITDKEPIDSPRNKLATDVYFSYSPAQQEKAGLMANRFRLHYSVANGSISVNQYNETDLGSTSELLTSLGINVSKSFSFNGKSFSLDAQDKSSCRTAS